MQFKENSVMFIGTHHVKLWVEWLEFAPGGGTRRHPETNDIYFIYRIGGFPKGNADAIYAIGPKKFGLPEGESPKSPNMTLEVLWSFIQQMTKHDMQKFGVIGMKKNDFRQIPIPESPDDLIISRPIVKPN